MPTITQTKFYLKEFVFYSKKVLKALLFLSLIILMALVWKKSSTQSGVGKQGSHLGFVGSQDKTDSQEISKIIDDNYKDNSDLQKNNPADPADKDKTITVQKGDSTWKLAERYYGDGYKYTQIEEINNLKHNQHLEIGQVLVIPVAEESELNTIADTSDTTESLSDNNDKTDKSYLVVRGDTLWDIASRELGSSTLWPKLYEQNRDLIGKDADLIYPGVMLKLRD